MGSQRLETERSPETVDRTLVGVCGAIWLVLVAASVFAVTALARLGSGHPGGGEKQSSWLLYTVIAVSALVIAGAVPLLLRARRASAADSGPAEEEAAPVAAHRAADAPAEKVRVFGVDPNARRAPEQPVEWAPAAAVDRLWLRGTVSLVAAIGLALTAVAVGTYLLAAVGDTAAWVALGVAGAITAAMPAILVFFQRRVDEAVREGAEAAGE